MADGTSPAASTTAQPAAAAALKLRLLKTHPPGCDCSLRTTQCFSAKLELHKRSSAQRRLREGTWHYPGGCFVPSEGPWGCPLVPGLSEGWGLGGVQCSPRQTLFSASSFPGSVAGSLAMPVAQHRTYSSGARVSAGGAQPAQG